MKKAGVGRAERQPHHAAARRRWRRRRRDAHASSSRTSTRRSAWRWSATTSTSPTPTRVVRFPYAPGDTRIAAAAAQGRRPARPARATITGPRASIASARRLEALRDVGLEQQRRPRTAWTRRKAAPRSGRSIRAPARKRLFATGPAQSERHGVGAGQRRAVDRGQRARRARQRPRARLHDLGAATAASTAGRTATTASTSTRASKPPRPDLVAKAIKPDYALGPHTASLGPGVRRAARAARRASRAACSSASTARGTASRRSGYKVIFVPFANGRPSGPSRDVLTGFLSATARRRAGPSASRSTSAAGCSSPTTSATRSGASRRQIARSTPEGRPVPARRGSPSLRSPRVAPSARIAAWERSRCSPPSSRSPRRSAGRRAWRRSAMAAEVRARREREHGAAGDRLGRP